ncbi:MAG: hypothetical protein F6K40_11150 [Okeania sp. SIO3I5]|uniref:hypothetical protein n=1 Tax=Okeania sp. SIO3I5 TaxID=2607805 RepID=UPI0013B715CA|nr:hypothetical protein [Okeania sp. SIO3I5]NEQ36803.1 hypothetical protein [Okeania sp. SIO3I5]
MRNDYIRSPASRSLSWQQKLTTIRIESSDRPKIAKPIFRAAVTVTRGLRFLFLSKSHPLWNSPTKQSQQIR